MNFPSIVPNSDTAIAVTTAMTNEKVLFASRMTTGEQYYVFAIKTTKSEYVIRMTTPERKNKFLSAIYWQEKLIPLGIPLAKFICSDLDNKYSSFPALLMKRLPGDDLCNLYLTLTPSDKKNLAKEIVKIQDTAKDLPEGMGYGMTTSYENPTEHKSWHDFLVKNLQFFIKNINKNSDFNLHAITEVISLANDMQEDLQTVRATPFLWDASERNVIVYQGKISGIIDVDNLCFGDPLLVTALTHVALETEGHDTLYTEYWIEALHLNKNAKKRFALYCLFYIVAFMSKHLMTSANNQQIIYNVSRLNNSFMRSLQSLKSL